MDNQFQYELLLYKQNQALYQPLLYLHHLILTLVSNDSDNNYDIKINVDNFTGVDTTKKLFVEELNININVSHTSLTVDNNYNSTTVNPGELSDFNTISKNGNKYRIIMQTSYLYNNLSFYTEVLETFAIVVNQNVDSIILKDIEGISSSSLSSELKLSSNFIVPSFLTGVSETISEYAYTSQTETVENVSINFSIEIEY